MKFSTTQKQLATAIQLVEKIVGKKESLPVLSCIVIQAEQHRLVIQATNLESSITVFVPAQIEQEGVVAIEAALISQLVRSITDDVVRGELQNDTFVVSTKQSKNILKTIPIAEFPFSTRQVSESSHMLDKDIFVEGIRSVVYAASPSMIRPELGSILFSFNEQSCVCVATDSFRLAEKTIKIHDQMVMDILIPLKYTIELLHILEHNPMPTIQWRVIGDSYIVFENEYCYYTTRIVDSKFPNYREIIPKDVHTEVIILKNDLIEVLRKARIFSDSEQCVGFHLYPERKNCTVTAQSARVGEMSDTLDVVMKGSDLDIKFHISYIADSLSSIQSDSVTLTFSGVGRPMIITGVSDQSFRYLVMPLNR